MKRSTIQSPRKRYLITLPEEPKPQLGGTAAQLALLVVAVNIGACLLAAHVMSSADQPEGNSEIAAGHDDQRATAADEATPAGRLARILFAK